MSEKSLLGIGLYTYPEAARIIGVDSGKLRRWARTYLYSSRGRTYLHEPVVKRSFPDEPILTFRELIELLFVRLFRDEGVTMTVIRRASDRASELFDDDYPFTVRRFDTDGSRIFATLQVPGDNPELIQDIARGQYAFETVVRPFFRKLDYGDGLHAMTLWPREHDGRVVLDPQRSFGQPIDAETGVPTQVLADAVCAGDGQTPEEVASWYEVPVDAVIAAVAYEHSPSVI